MFPHHRRLTNISNRTTSFVYMSIVLRLHVRETCRSSFPSLSGSESRGRGHFNRANRRLCSVYELVSLVTNALSLLCGSGAIPNSTPQSINQRSSCPSLNPCSSPSGLPAHGAIRTYVRCTVTTVLPIWTGMDIRTSLEPHTL